MALDLNAAVKIKASVDGLRDIDGLQRGMKGLGDQADKTKGKFAGLKSVMAGLGSAIAAVGLTRILGESSRIAGEFEAQTMLLSRGLKNIGADANQLGILQKEADRLGKVTLFNEEDFRKGFGLLTSFGNIAIGEYGKVAMAAANVAQVSGTDVNAAMMQLAKALNDPIKGLSALGRSGIQFTEDQKTMIESMVEAGNVAGAQTMIMQELEKQYGGTAEAAAGGAAGVQDTFGEAMYDLNVAIGQVVNTALPPLLTLLTQVIEAFTKLPQPVQSVLVGLGALAGAAAVLAPLVGVIGSIGSAFAGLMPAITAIGSAIGSLLPIIAGVFSGPVGWIALLVAAGAAIWAFRDQIGAAFKALGTIISEAAKAFKAIFIDPVIRWNRFLYDKSIEIFSKMAEIVKRPFQAIASFIRTIINGIMGGIQVSINNAVLAINVLIRGANRALAALKLPQIPQVPTVSLPRFADGGYVTRPTVAMVGEGGEPEYIVPQSKAAGFAANYLAGQRGAAAVPSNFAGNGAMPSTAQINIRTGPVLQQDNARYVTVKDMEQALQTMADTLLGSVRSAGGRRYVGLT
jgi:hypothetical protein